MAKDVLTQKENNQTKKIEDSQAEVRKSVTEFNKEWDMWTKSKNKKWEPAKKYR